MQPPAIACGPSGATDWYTGSLEPHAPFICVTIAWILAEGALLAAARDMIIRPPLRVHCGSRDDGRRVVSRETGDGRAGFRGRAARDGFIVVRE